MSGTLPGSYTPNVPLGNQQINNTQQPIETNFQDIADLVAINHIPFNTADTFGKHNFVTYYNQTLAPGASTNQIVVFSRKTSNGVQLFYQYPNNSTIYPLSGGGNSNNLIWTGGVAQANISPYFYYGNPSTGYVGGCGTFLFNLGLNTIPTTGYSTTIFQNFMYYNLPAGTNIIQLFNSNANIVSLNYTGIGPGGSVTYLLPSSTVVNLVNPYTISIAASTRIPYINLSIIYTGISGS